MTRSAPPDSCGEISTRVPGFGSMRMPFTLTGPSDASAGAPSIVSRAQHALLVERLARPGRPRSRRGVAGDRRRRQAGDAPDASSAGGFSTLPARSTALICNRCVPGVETGRLQRRFAPEVDAPPSSEHSNRARSVAPLAKRISASGALSVPDGPDSSTVTGATVSTRHSTSVAPTAVRSTAGTGPRTCGRRGEPVEGGRRRARRGRPAVEPALEAPARRPTVENAKVALFDRESPGRARVDRHDGAWAVAPRRTLRESVHRAPLRVLDRDDGDPVRLLDPVRDLGAVGRPDGHCRELSFSPVVRGSKSVRSPPPAMV